MLEPGGNNNFFVKNERIGGGGGRAEVAEDIKVRGAPSVGSPGLCISQMCCCKGQPVKRNKHTVLLSHVSSRKQADGAHVGSLGMTIQDFPTVWFFGSKETRLILFCSDYFDYYGLGTRPYCTSITGLVLSV